MPENYYTTDHISDSVIATLTTADFTTSGAEHRNELIITPEPVEILGTTYSYTPAIGGNFKTIKYETYNPLHVDRIIFSPPATIVFWKDGTKTVVKCADGEPFSEYNGFAAALLKKVFGSNSAVKKIIQRKKQYATPAKANSNSAKDADLEQRFKELVNEYEHLKNRAENLNLYLRKVETTFPVTWLTLLDAFSDMPGYESIMEESHGN